MRFGAWAALVALALNLAVAFSHHHFYEAVSHGFAGTHGAFDADEPDESDHDQHERSTHLCLTCSVVMVTAFVADTPAVALQSSWTETVVAVTARPQPRDDSHSHFEARAPPPRADRLTPS